MDEMRKHIAKLKADLDVEKARYKQLHRDKVADVRNVREQCHKERDDALEALTSKLEHQKHLETQRMRDACNKEKDVEIRAIVKARDDEMRQVKAQISEEKEEAIRAALEMQKRALSDASATSLSGGQRPAASNSALVIKLQREIKQLKDAKKDIEEQLRLRTQSDNDKTAEMRRLQHEHDVTVKRLMRESKQEVARGYQQLRRAEDALNSKSKQINAKDVLVDKLHLEKEILGEQLRHAKMNATEHSAASSQSTASQSLEDFKTGATDADGVILEGLDVDTERQCDVTDDDNVSRSTSTDGIHVSHSGAAVCMYIVFSWCAAVVMSITSLCLCGSHESTQAAWMVCRATAGVPVILWMVWRAPASMQVILWMV